jgi:opacity protein-like surface antigen
MKKLLTVLFIMGTCQTLQAGGYFEGVGGTDNYGYKMGLASSRWDASIGYQTTQDCVDLHVLGLELYRSYRINEYFSVKGGAGIGLGIPNAETGGSNYDNGTAYSLGAGIECFLTPRLSVNVLGKGIFFKSDTHVRTYGSHHETLSNGQGVEVEDVYEQYAPRTLNRGVVSVGLRYYF